MQLRNPKDFWTGIIYIVVGALFLFIARDYRLGTALKMGPAYFPVILSVLLILIGGISLTRSFLRPGSPIGGISPKSLLIVVASVVLFGLLIRPAGLIVALPLLVIGSAAASSRFEWRYALGLAAGLLLFCWLVFLKALGVPIPLVGTWFGG